jgi:hypothetical protein
MTVLRRRGHPLLNDSPSTGAPVRQRSHLEGSLPLKFWERVGTPGPDATAGDGPARGDSRDFETAAPEMTGRAVGDRQASTNVGAATAVPARRR